MRYDGTAPYCAMVQVSEEDTYDDYVVCRGFDTRILRYMGTISVAKPFGKRITNTYNVGEIYPAFLPTQGNANPADLRQVTYVPPSPVNVKWRVGQNPGTVTGGGLSGGQPEELTDEIAILYDHNGKAVNWLLIDSGTRTETLRYFYPPSTGIPAAAYNGITEKLTVGVATCIVAIEDPSFPGRYKKGTTTEEIENIVTNVVGSSGRPIGAIYNGYGTWTAVIDDCDESAAGGGDIAISDSEQKVDPSSKPTPSPSTDV